MNTMEWIAQISESANTVTIMIGIAAFVLQALALYTIAQRRCIKKAWLAWVPVINVWILGSISDQYRYVTKREVKNKRKILLGLNIAIAAIVLVWIVMAVWVVLQMIVLAGGSLMGWLEMFQMGQFGALELIADQILLPLVIMALLALPLSILVIVAAVFYWIAMYDVFRSCDPDNSLICLIAGLVGGFVLEGVECIPLMICRNKDLGMPPRKPEIIDEAAPQPENNLN